MPLSDLPTATADPTATTDPPPAGSTTPLPAAADRYLLGAEIARGGMGVIHRAADAVLGREVALKVLQDRFAPGSGTALRFADEARIAAQLQHPGIPPVYDLGVLPDGRPFLAMKLIKGETLGERLRARPNPATDRGAFVAAFEKVCEAVAYAHERGVIHRDLKPANVMVGSFGEVQVMDWGLAKVLTVSREAQPSADPHEADPEETATSTRVVSLRESDGSATQAGIVLGTPAYMPPEQAIGAVGKIDARSDVFGLGAILAVILTGEPPFAADSAETTRLKAARGDVADCFERLNACGAEPGLVALCKRCLAPRPEDRPADAGLVAFEVAGLRAAAEDRARRAERDRAAAEARAEEARRRRKTQLALAAAVGLLAVGAGAAAWWQDRQATQQRFETEARVREEAGRTDRDRREAADLLDRAADALRAGDPDRAAVPLDQAQKRLAAGGPADVAGRADRLAADLALVRALDQTDHRRWTPAGYTTPSQRDLVPDWAAAFAGFGIVPGTTPPADAARLLDGSAVRDRALAALDRWHAVGRSAGVAGVLSAADPDPFRQEVRAAIRTSDADRLRELAGRDAARDQPAWFAAVLGEQAAIPVPVRRGLLERANAAWPTDLAVLMALDRLHPINRRAGADERARWCQAAVAARPGNVTAWYSLGVALYDRGDSAGAVRCYRRSLALDPTHAMSYTALGLALGDVEDPAGAKAAAWEAVRLAPGVAQLHYNLGAVLRDFAEELPAAERAIGEAVRLDPNRPEFRLGLGVLRWRGGDVAAAAGQFREAVRLAPDHAKARQNLGGALMTLGDAAGAAAELREAVRLDPKDPPGQNNLAWLLAVGPDGHRDGRAAVEAATKACELNGWKEVTFIATLAAAHAEAGDFAKAVEYQKRALAQVGTGPRAATYRERLALYEGGRAYRDPAFVTREVAPPPREASR